MFYVREKATNKLLGTFWAPWDAIEFAYQVADEKRIGIVVEDSAGNFRLVGSPVGAPYR